ncbi:unnamed protein product [Effrenium voratum]|nr:unnamed protein product [Effrenium voratum]
MSLANEEVVPQILGAVKLQDAVKPRELPRRVGVRIKGPSAMRQMRARARAPAKSVRNVLQEDFQRKEGSAEELVARYPECEGLDVIWQVSLGVGGLGPTSKQRSLCALAAAELTRGKPGALKQRVSLGRGEVLALEGDEVLEASDASGPDPQVLCALSSGRHWLRWLELKSGEVEEIREEGVLVLYAVSGCAAAYFPRLKKVGGKLCLCPDCRADGGGDGFKVRAQDALVMQPAQGISLVAVEEAALVAAVFELRSARL